MPRVLSFNNCACLKCGSVLKDMIKVGAMIFCSKCYHDEFESITTLNNGGYTVPLSDKYSYWLKQYHKEVEDA